jgi:hypothetical protein
LKIILYGFLSGVKLLVLKKERALAWRKSAEMVKFA